MKEKLEKGSCTFAIALCFLASVLLITICSAISEQILLMHLRQAAAASAVHASDIKRGLKTGGQACEEAAKVAELNNATLSQCEYTTAGVQVELTAQGFFGSYAVKAHAGEP